MPKISVITPASRGVDVLSHLLRDFRNQTLPKSLWEHIIIWDGDIPEDVRNFMNEHKNDYNIQFTNIEKDSGNMSIAPGTKPRNYGISIAQGAFCCFCDDDDRYKDIYLEKLAIDLHDNALNVVQMSCSESRMFKNGDPDKIRAVPEIGLPTFPMICHIGTPCFIVKREWALNDPWQEEPEHDFRFLKRICDKYKPQVRIIPEMLVDVDGLVIKGMKDWVSHPPFYRED